MSGHTPGPWDYVPGTEHHGPYVTSDFGSTICDCYVMSEPTAWSTMTPKPVNFMHEMAEPNARLIASAPEMLAALKAVCGDNPNLSGNTWDMLNRAVDKAEGR